MIERFELSSNELSQLGELFDEQLIPWGYRISFDSLLFNGLLRLVGPYDLVVCENSLTLMIQNPLNSSFLDCIYKVFVTVSYYSFHCFNHLLLEIVKPHFDIEARAHSVYQFYNLTFWTYQSFNRSGCLFLNVQRAYTLEKFIDVFLDYVHVVGVG